MERIEESKAPQSLRTIVCTPTQLRTIADRLEAESRKITAKGEQIFLELTPKIMIMFNPEEVGK